MKYNFKQCRIDYVNCILADVIVGPSLRSLHNATRLQPLIAQPVGHTLHSLTDSNLIIFYDATSFLDSRMHDLSVICLPGTSGPMEAHRITDFLAGLSIDCYQAVCLSAILTWRTNLYLLIVGLLSAPFNFLPKSLVQPIPRNLGNNF
jgi:hypothetical protein